MECVVRNIPERAAQECLVVDNPQQAPRYTSDGGDGGSGRWGFPTLEPAASRTLFPRQICLQTAPDVALIFPVLVSYPLKTA